MVLKPGKVLQHIVKTEFIVQLLQKGERNRWSCKILKGEAPMQKGVQLQTIWSTENQEVAFYVIPYDRQTLIKWFKEMKLGKDLYS
jgi:hypothetical protein